MTDTNVEMFHSGTFDIPQETGEIFPYADVDTAYIARLHELDSIMLGCIKRSQEEMATMGACLLEAKASLPHGLFTKWYKVRYGLSKTTAWRMMQVAQGKVLPSKTVVQELLPQKAQTLTMNEDECISAACTVMAALCYVTDTEKRWDVLSEEEQEARAQNCHDMLESAPQMLRKDAPLLCRDMMIAIGKRYQENLIYLPDHPYDAAILAMANKVKLELDGYHIIARIITDEHYTDQAKIDLDSLEKRGIKLGLILKS